MNLLRFLLAFVQYEVMRSTLASAAKKAKAELVSVSVVLRKIWQIVFADHLQPSILLPMSTSPASVRLAPKLEALATDTSSVSFSFCLPSSLSFSSRVFSVRDTACAYCSKLRAVTLSRNTPLSKVSMNLSKHHGTRKQLRFESRIDGASCHTKLGAISLLPSWKTYRTFTSFTYVKLIDCSWFHQQFSLFYP